MISTLNIDFKEIAFIDRNEGFISEFHVHNWFDISFIMKGSLIYELGDNVYNVSEGEVVIVAPGKPHKEICPKENFEVLFVCMSFTRDGSAFNVLEQLGISEVTHIADIKRIYDIFEDILNEVTYRNYGYLLKINAQVYNLLVTLCRNMDENSGRIKSIKKISNFRKIKISEEIREYMENCYEQKISLRELSKRFYLSPQYISYLFRHNTGYTPIEYLNKIRIKKAKELLASGMDNVTKVAERVGISDIHYFYKVFKQFEKNTPAQYISHLDDKC